MDGQQLTVLNLRSTKLRTPFCVELEMETGHHIPRFSTVKKLAEALGVDPRELMLREENGAGS